MLTRIYSSYCYLYYTRSLGDVIGITGTYKAANFLEQFITPALLPNPLARTAAHVSLWALYGFVTGLFGTGLWVIAHECGHQAFSESKAINNTVGWVLHSAWVSIQTFYTLC